MYKSLELVNFGKHKKLKILFDQFVTVIQGVSGSGKSTLFRAIKLIAHSRPTRPDKKFNYKFLKKYPFKVILEKDGYKITREKDKYIINDNKPLVAFRNNVPEPVSRILNLKAINWQSQLVDQHYLVFDTPGAVAKIINKEIGLEDSLNLINALKGKISTAKSEFKRIQINLSENKKTIDKIKPLIPLFEEAKELRAFEEHVYALCEQEEEIGKLLAQLELIELDLADAEDIKSLYKEVQDLDELHDLVKGKLVESTNLKRLLQDIEKSAPVDYEHLLVLKNEIEELIDIEKESDKADKKVDSLIELLESIGKIDEKLEYGRKQQEQIQSEFDEALSQLKICPYRNKPCPLAKGK